MALAWRLLDHGRPSWAKEVVFDDMPFGQPVGYILEVWRKGHYGCGCMLSGSCGFWMSHDPAIGEWPAYYQIQEYYKTLFLEAHPEFEVRSATISYGFLRF